MPVGGDLARATDCLLLDAGVTMTFLSPLSLLGGSP